MMPEDVQRVEAARIEAEYARRSRELAPDMYSLAHEANLFARQQLERVLIRLLRRNGSFPFHDRRAADIGCGGGSWLLEYANWGASTSQLAGIDIDPAKITRAACRLADSDLIAGDASQLPWESNTFDIVSQYTLFSSILSAPVREMVAREMLRVLKPGGLVIWYDMRVDNPRNRSVKGMGEAEIGRLFPDCRIDREATTLAPPIARRVVPVSWTVACALELFPVLRTHYAAVIRKPAVPPSTSEEPATLERRKNS